MICNIFMNSIVSILIIAQHYSDSVVRYCIWNATKDSKATVSCTNGRIEIHILIYANISNQTADCGLVSLPPNSVKIQQDQLRKHKLYTECSFTHGCSEPITDSCLTGPCPSFNFFYMEFSCVKESEIIDICGDVKKTIFSPTNIAYFGHNWDAQNGAKNCNCVIEHGVHNITLGHVTIPCNMAILSLKWKTSEKMETQERYVVNKAVFTREKIVSASTSTSLSYNTTCYNPAELVWLKIVPEAGSQPTVYCGTSVENISSTTNTSSSPLVPTILTTAAMGETTQVYMDDTESIQATPETTNGKGEARKLGLIIGCSVGGLALMVIILIPFIICYRRRRRYKKQPSVYGHRLEETNAVTYANYWPN